VKLRISRGDEGLRRLLVQSAHYTRTLRVRLRSQAAGEDQKRWRLRQTTRHRCSRQEAGCALAPTLASQEVYEPLRNSDKTLAKLPEWEKPNCLLTHPEVVYALVG